MKDVLISLGSIAAGAYILRLDMRLWPISAVFAGFGVLAWVIFKAQDKAHSCRRVYDAGRVRRIGENMQRTRRLLPDSQQAHARWAAEDEADARVIQRMKAATIIGALSIAAIWLSVAVVPQYAPAVATVAVLFAVVVWATMWGWAIKAAR